MQGVSVRRNPPHGNCAPHILRITPRPDKGGKPKLNHVARLIRLTMGDFYLPYAVDTICPPSVPQPNEYK